MQPESEEDNDLGDNSDHPGGNCESQSTYAPRKATPPYGRGLAPTDLIALPEESRELITWLARRQMATVEEIQQALNKKRDLLVTPLEKLLTKGYVKEMIIEGVKFYRVVFHAKPRRGPQGLGEDLWERLDMNEGKTQEE